MNLDACGFVNSSSNSVSSRQHPLCSSPEPAGAEFDAEAIGPVIEDLGRLKLHDVSVPTTDGREFRVPSVTEPDKSKRRLMSHLRLQIP